jgi:hypothetical protein
MTEDILISALFFFLGCLFVLGTALLVDSGRRLMQKSYE